MSAISGRRVVSPTLVGRDTELETLASAVRKPPAVVTIHGDAGLGKTRLVSELAERDELSGRQLAVGYCRRIREPFPLGPLTEAIRGLGDVLATMTYSPVVGALRPLLPEVARWLPPPLAPLDDRAGERHRLFRGMVELFASLGPAVLVLEDMHWADASTPELLGYLLADPPPQLAVVMTTRAGDGAATAQAATAGLPASMARADITLAPLDEKQTGALAARILGQSQITTELASFIWAQTSGVPFAVEELIALLQARDVLVRSREGWVRKKLEQLEVPAGIRAQVLERIGDLSPAARAVVEAAAVLQTPTTASVLRATCHGSDDDIRRGLDEALQTGVLVATDDLIGFRHLLAASAVAEGIPAPIRQELHCRAVDALTPLDPAPLGRLAHHLHEAGRRDEWATVAERAADQAAELGHDAEAARLLEAVLGEVSAEGRHKGRVAIKLARAALETVQVSGDLTDLLAAVLDEDLPAAIQGELRFRLALLYEAVGADPRRVRDLHVAAVDALDHRPDLKAWAMVCLGIHTASGVPLAEHRRWVQRVLAILPDIGPSTFQTFLLGKAAMELITFGDPSGRQLIKRLIEQTDGAPRDRRAVNAYQSVGMAASYAGHHTDAAALLRPGLDSPVTRESRKLELRMRSAMAYLDYCRGQWDGLHDTVAMLLDELVDYPLARIDIEVVDGCLALARGDLRHARQQLPTVATAATKLGVYELVAPVVAAMARMAAADKSTDQTVDRVREFIAAIDAKDFWMPAVRALPAITQLLVAVHRTAEAEALIDRSLLEMDRLDAPLASGTVPHAKGWLEVGSGRQVDAAEQFLQAAARYDTARCPYEAAQAREAAATCLLDVDAGTPHTVVALTAALTAYQELGASWDRDRAARLARRHGIAVPGLHRGGRHGYADELSPREHEVARLVAVGRTNKEIASELYISPRTVEKHVSAAFRKLDVRSRTGLAARIDERPGAR